MTNENILKVIKRDGRTTEYNEGKISDAIYAAAETVGGTDQDIADELAAQITSTVMELEDIIPTVEDIQDIVEKTLIGNGYASTAKAYILYRSERNKAREMHKGLMRTYEDLTFTDTKDADLKRENANIDGDTAMGTMLRYGSEGAKQFNHMYLLSKEASEAHKAGNIHIHDLDFYALTATCLTGDTEITIVELPEIGEYGEEDKLEVMGPKTVTLDYFDKYYKEDEEGLKLPKRHGIITWGRDLKPADTATITLPGTKLTRPATRIKNCNRRKLKPGEKVFRLQTSNGHIDATGKHEIPVMRDGEEISIEVFDIKVGDKLIKNTGKRTNQITSIKPIPHNGYVYDLETGNHHFSANGFIVHNCLQIDLNKLFTGGFNTGHGYLREPNDILSYSALACIAIQSNQNEMHKEYCAFC